MQASPDKWCKLGIDISVWIIGIFKKNFCLQILLCLYVYRNLELQIFDSRQLKGTNYDKVQQIFKSIEADVDGTSFSLKRLGKHSAPRKRPILVTFANRVDRQIILDKAKGLKHSTEELSKVYIKKDIHPAVRKEFHRLRMVEKEEKSKEQNRGKMIAYDHKRRVVTCDGEIIDSYKPSFF